MSQGEFFECGAQDLSVIENETVDAVTMRAVLDYVPDKAAAFREAYRLLKDGRRISFAEPMMREDALQCVAMRNALDLGGDDADSLIAVLHRWKLAQFPDTVEGIAANPLTNCIERDLIRLALDSGFVDIHVELHIDVRRLPPLPWSNFVWTSPHPFAPTPEVILRDRFRGAKIQVRGRAERSGGSWWRRCHGSSHISDRKHAR